MTLAVWPDLVAARMALAPRSMAVRQQEWVMASLMLETPGVREFSRKRPQ